MDKNKQTLQEKVADFGIESGQPIFLIDYNLFERFGHDLDEIVTHLTTTYPTIFDSSVNDHERLIDLLKTALHADHCSFNKKENGTKIISFISMPVNDFYLYEAAHKASATPVDDNNALTPEARIAMIEAQDSWDDYVLYHELFHAIDPRLQNVTVEQNSDPTLKFTHQVEFFADFASCLYLASKGNDLFLDVAKQRSRDLQSSSMSSTFKKGQFGYSNHQIYAIFKAIKIDPIGMTIAEIVNVTTAVTEEFAFDSKKLGELAAFALNLNENDVKARITAMGTGTLAVINRNR